MNHCDILNQGFQQLFLKPLENYSLKKNQVSRENIEHIQHRLGVELLNLMNQDLEANHFPDN